MTTAFRLRDTESLPIPVRARKAAIIGHAETLREVVKLRNGFDLPSLVAANNGEIITQDALDPDPTRAFEMDPGGYFKIYLSSLRDSLSNIMITACELGHLVLHKHRFTQERPGKSMVVPKQVGDLGEDLSLCKWETFWFSQGLLMPEAEFMEIFEKRGLDDAAAYFAVTREAAFTRHDQIMKVRQQEVPPAPVSTQVFDIVQ